MFRVLPDDQARADLLTGLDELCREGARRMLAAAVRAEADAYVDAFTHEVDEQGHRLVVRNGYAQERTITTAAGAIEVKAPRVDDRRLDEATGQRRRFTSSILPLWCRRSPKVADVLPLLYLHGMRPVISFRAEIYGRSSRTGGVAPFIYATVPHAPSLRPRGRRSPTIAGSSKR